MNLGCRFPKIIMYMILPAIEARSTIKYHSDRKVVDELEYNKLYHLHYLLVPIVCWVKHRSIPRRRNMAKSSIHPCSFGGQIHCSFARCYIFFMPVAASNTVVLSCHILSQKSFHQVLARSVLLLNQQ